MILRRCRRVIISMGFEKKYSKKTGRFFSNVKAKGKDEHLIM